MPPKKKAKASASTSKTKNTSLFTSSPNLSSGTPWPHHEDSDDSDAYDPDDLSPVTSGAKRTYRALNDSESDPFTKGITPANPKRKSRTIAQHVQGGGNSSFISLTTNKRKAVKWAKSGKHTPRVATVDLPPERQVVDLSNPEIAHKAGLGNTGANFARSSSEVLVKGPIPSTSIKRVERIKKATNRSRNTTGLTVKTRVHTGTSKTRKKPQELNLESISSKRK